MFASCFHLQAPPGTSLLSAFPLTLVHANESANEIVEQRNISRAAILMGKEYSIRPPPHWRNDYIITEISVQWTNALMGSREEETEAQG